MGKKSYTVKNDSKGRNMGTGKKYRASKKTGKVYVRGKKGYVWVGYA